MLRKAGFTAAVVCCILLNADQANAAPWKDYKRPATNYQIPYSRRSNTIGLGEPSWEPRLQTPDDVRRTLQRKYYEDELSRGFEGEGNDEYDFYNQMNHGGSEYRISGQPDYSELYDMLMRIEEEQRVERNRQMETQPMMFREAMYYPDPKGKAIEGSWSRESLNDDGLRSILKEGDRENEGQHDPSHQDGFDVLQRIGMRLVDVTEKNEDERSGAEGEEETDGDMEKSEAEKISVGKVKVLLEQLQDAESKRALKPEEMILNKEMIDRNQLAAMLGKEEPSKPTSQAADKSEDVVSGDEGEESKEPTEGDLKDELLVLMYNQNVVLIEAMQTIPFGDIRSQEVIATLRALLNKAVTMQNAVHYLSSQLNQMDREK